MNIRKGVIAAVGAATVAATAGGVAFAQLSPTSGVATGGAGGAGGRGGITRFTINAGCTADNTNRGAGTQVIARSGNSCGRSDTHVRASNNSNGGKGGNGGNARSGNAFNRF
jgi:hypothetical protein